MVSPVPGLITQMVGFLMKQRYKYATVFIDQVSRMGFVYLQKTCSAEETIKAKRPFEKYAENQEETTRVILIHASKRWPGVVTIHLWPYTMRMANQAYNSTPLSSHIDKQSLNKIFDKSAVNLNPKHWKPFGCPAYILKAEFQGTTGIHPKWDARS